jgi:4-carboxymuconolactone decarboxylase
MCVKQACKSSASCCLVRCPTATSACRDGKFGDELLEIGIDNVFGRLWGHRDRSLVTLGILIALRATDELKIHFKVAREVFDEQS